MPLARIQVGFYSATLEAEESRKLYLNDPQRVVLEVLLVSLEPAEQSFIVAQSDRYISTRSVLRLESPCVKKQT